MSATWRPWAFGDGYGGYGGPILAQVRPPPLRPAQIDPPEDPAAQLCWGVPADWQVLDPTPAPGLTVIWPERDECDPESLFYDKEKCEEKQVCDEYTEDWREYQVVRVTNPDDDEQYVDVERFTKVQFTGPPARSADGKESGENRKVCFVFTQHPNEGSVLRDGRRGSG